MEREYVVPIQQADPSWPISLRQFLDEENGERKRNDPSLRLSLLEVADRKEGESEETNLVELK
jgi:hypothetical protein